ncbi:carbohydrate ABC transporter permease [Deinococcus psychrotolerans]|uniref:carbohydrate ABC transporter permease n=1 Tax=Deinococcus psychrotolerans TaxID=2489213 RepID=UPI0013DE5C5D|nr:sugar ABC transporter permease [Deinococcus psychrotolerans]
MTARAAGKKPAPSGYARVSWWLFIPTLLPVVVLSVWPLLQGVYLGFTDYTLGAQSRKFIWFGNFAKMSSDRQFWSSFQIGAVWTVTVTAGVIVLGMGLALLLNARLPGQAVARVLVLIPWAIPPVIKGMIWRLIYHPSSGFLNGFLVSVGILKSPIDWLGSFTWALPAVIVVGIWTGLPQATVVLLAGLQTIPEDLHEAASLDGASSWQQLRHVTLPLMMPVILAVSALEFMWNFNSFGLVYTLTEGGPAGTTRLPMLFAYEEAFRYGNIAYASALGLAIVLIIGLALLYSVRSQFLSATKAAA